MKRLFSKQHRENISKANKGRVTWSKGKKMPVGSLYKNMISHLKYNVTLEWLEQFDDVEKLKFLNRSIVRDRDRIGFTDNTYMRFVEKFYYDKQFNAVYKKWLSSDKNKWYRPSLDHINPKSKSGSLVDIDNLQFITWLENRAKVDMPADEWKNIKERIQDYFV